MEGRSRERSAKSIVPQMFTGIIETVGEVSQFGEFSPNVWRLEIRTSLARDLNIGDSLANNGVCLTVVSRTPETIGFDLLNETVTRTNLRELKSGALINLERPMKASGRFDGHIVQGHIDSVGPILGMESLGSDHRVEIGLPDEFCKYVVFKGSIAVNGISLTVVDAREKSFVVWIIPHTWKETNLHSLQPGAHVNLEFDIVAKYVERMLIHSPASTL
jgi:riboflavin synthase